MRHRLFTLAAAIAVVTSLSLVGHLPGTPATTAAVHAQTYNSNPAPFNRFKAPISPAGLLGLSHQPNGSSGSRFSTNGEGDTGANSPLGSPVLLRSGSSDAFNARSGTGPQGGINQAPEGSIVFNNDPSAEEQNETSVTVQQTGPTGNANLITDAVVGGENDFRGFEYVPGCSPNPGGWCYPARNCVSLSGFSVSLNGGQSLAKSGCLPWVGTYQNGTYTGTPSNPGPTGTVGSPTYQPFGDPALDRDTHGNVFYGSLGFDQTTTTTTGNNGITIFSSTPSLFNSSSSCQNTTTSSNPCWRGQVVYSQQQATNSTAGAPPCEQGYCGFADKDWIAVDRYSTTPYNGSVYVEWNNFNVQPPSATNPNGFTSQINLSRCDPSPTSPTGFSGCTTPIIASAPGDIFTGGGSYVTVTRDGHVLVSYYNFGTTTTFYPVVGRVCEFEPGGQVSDGCTTVVNMTQDGNASSLPCVPNNAPATSVYANTPCLGNTYVSAAAGVTFRLPNFIKIDADRTPGSSRVYVTTEQCTTPQYYPSYDNTATFTGPLPYGNIVYSGNCPKVDVYVGEFNLNNTTFGKEDTSTNPNALPAAPISYVNVTHSFQGQQFFPYVSVDESNGNVLLTYNSTQDDPFQNEDSVYSLISKNGGASFLPVISAGSGGQIAPPYQITKDPAGYFGQGSAACAGNASSTGCPGYAPENGDYLQGLAYFHRLYVHYQGTYLQKGFAPDFNGGDKYFFLCCDGQNPMNQDDNFLRRVLY